MSGAQWTGKTRGGYLGNKIFIWLLKIGVLPAYALLVFVAAYFALLKRKLGVGSRIYLEKMFGNRPGFFSPRVYRHFFNFGMTLIDRTAYLSGNGKIKLECSDSDGKLRAALAEGKGVVVLAAHIGGWQAASSALVRFGVPVKVLGVDFEDEKISRMISRTEKMAVPEVTDSSGGDFAGAYGTLRGGGIVAMHADRYMSGRFSEKTFLGQGARFPTFAYSLAKSAGAPLVQIICVRTSLFKYETFAYRLGAGGSDPLDDYVKNIEAILGKYPFQWFNFFDFWTQ